MLKYLFISIFGAIISSIKTKAMFKKCLISDVSDNGVETLEYKGKLYDKAKFIELKKDELWNYKFDSLVGSYKKLKESLPNSKEPDFDAARLEAHRLALLEKPEIKSTRLYKELSK